ncbi:MAG: TetR/AcrR family transcriptional regulator [Deltaproteobacteria bacterium]|nr:TetR/AcrR family transcriptional regulator [Deltaproteobacteria bacterium]
MNRRKRNDEGLGVILLDAAMAIVDGDGQEKFSLREVARRAGVSHTAPYNHFESKSHLLAEVALLGWEELDASMNDAQQVAADDAKSQLVATGMGYILYALRHPHRYRLMQTPGLCDVLKDDKSGLQDQAIIRLRVAAGHLRKEAGHVEDSQALDADCLLAWSLVHGMVGLFLDANVEALSLDNLPLHRLLLEKFSTIWAKTADTP